MTSELTKDQHLKTLRSGAVKLKGDRLFFAGIVAKEIERRRKVKKQATSIVALNQQISDRVKSLDSAAEKLERFDGDYGALADMGACRVMYSDIDDIDVVRELFENPKEVSDFLAREWPKNRPEIVEVYCKDNIWRPKRHMYPCYYIVVGMRYGNTLIRNEVQLLHMEMQETERLSHVTYKNEQAYKDKVRAGIATAKDHITRRGFIESLVQQNVNDIVSIELFRKMDPQLLKSDSPLVLQIQISDPDHFSALSKLHKVLAELAEADKSFTFPGSRIAASRDGNFAKNNLSSHRGERVTVRKIKVPNNKLGH